MAWRLFISRNLLILKYHVNISYAPTVMDCYLKSLTQPLCIARVCYCCYPGFRFNLFQIWAWTNTAYVTGKFCHQQWRSWRSSNARKISIFRMEICLRMVKWRWMHTDLLSLRWIERRISFEAAKHESPPMKTLFAWRKVQGRFSCCFKSFFL